MKTSPLTNRGLTLPAIVTLALLTALAVLVAGASAVSAQGTVPDAPDRPTGTAIFVGGVDLEWNDLPGAGSYDVQMYRNGQWTDLPGDSIKIAFYGAGAIISELEPEGSSYWFRVRARNTHGFSEWSDFNFMAPTSEFQSGQRARPDNIPADGAPVIEGTAQVGESLTADTSGIEDGNGLDRVQFRFQWVSHDGSADTDIANATDSIYTVAATDVGNTIKVRVAFTDRGGYAESLTGGETTTVAAGSNSPATGQPTIAGTAQVGEALTADTSSIADADGLTKVSYSYQWFANDGTADTDIAGATDFTYTLADADEGAAVKVKVSFTDDAGNEEELTSAATDTVAFAVQQQVPNTPATGAPTISGTAQVGETLTAGTSGIADADGLTKVSYSYQWVANDGTADSGITGATASTYALVADDEGKTIKVRVSFTDDAGNDESLTSAATEAVSFAVQQQVANYPTTGAPAITGTVQVGETLTADTSSIADADGLSGATFSYQWVANDGSSDTDIADATDSTYTLIAADEGKTIKVRVSFTDDADNNVSLTSAATGAVAAAPPSYITVVVSEDTSDPNDIVSNFTVIWSDSDDCSTDYNAYLNIYPETGLGQETPGNQLHLGSASFDETRMTKGLAGVQGSFEGFNVELYCGTDGSGRMVSRVDIAPWQSPTTRPSPGTYSSKPPLSALSVSHGTMTPTFESHTSDYTVPDVDNADTRITITAIPKAGYFVEFYEASDLPVGSMVAYGIDPNGPPTSDSADCSRYHGDALGPLFELTDADPNTPGFQVDVYDGENYVHVRVLPTYCGFGTGYNLAITRAEGTISSLRPNRSATDLPIVRPVLRRGPYVGLNLNADVSRISDRDGWDEANFNYQWLADDAEITGVTSSSYTVADAELGKTLRVRVSFTDDRGNEELLTSPATKEVKLRNRDPIGKPIILGTLEVGQTLRADVSGISDPNGMTNATFSYEWNFLGSVRDGEEYTLVDLDGERFGQLIVTYTDDAGHEERVWSELVGVVAPRPNSLATGAPAISGTAQVGETLTADTSGIADDDGLTNVSYSYQWVANDGTSDTDIVGATDSTYTLVVADEGKTIKVRVSFTDDVGNGETLTSTATDTVSFATQQQTFNSPATGAPTISGTAQVGETLMADTTGIADQDGLTGATFTYQWVANDGTADTDIAGATDSTYTVAADDEGNTIKVRVSFTDDAGNAEGLTSAAADSTEGICGRTTQVLSEIMWAINDHLEEELSCEDVTDEHLSQFRSFHSGSGHPIDEPFGHYHVGSRESLNIGGHRLTSLKEGDFDGLGEAISGIYISWNDIESLPDDVFEGLTRLETMALQVNNLANLPDGIFDDLTNLETLLLYHNDLTSIPEGIFDNLTNLQRLELWANDINSLPSSLPPSNNNHGLELSLAHNELTELPEGLFLSENLNITELTLHGNPGSPFGINMVGEVLEDNVSNDGIRTARIRYVVREAAPVDMSADVSVTGGSVSESSVSVTAGEMYSGEMTVTQEVAGESAIVSLSNLTTGDIGAFKGVTFGVASLTLFDDDAPVNTPATGAPTISGTAQVGETLTADTSGIVDADGLTNVSYSYQWLFSRDTEINGATSPTYTLQASDNGKVIKVRVSFTDDAGNDEELTSAATGAVEARPNSPATGAPTISGPVQVGKTLTADTSGIADADGLTNVSYSYQWISIDGTSDTDIAGATDSTYTLVADDEGKTITVRVSFTDDAGNAESLTSAATEKVKVRQWGMSLSWYCGPVDWTNFDLKGCNIERPVVFGVNLREVVNDDDPSTVDYVLRMDMLHENGTDANECEGTNMGTDIEVTTVDDEVVIGSGSLGNAGCEPGVYKMRFSAREGASATWHSLESHELWLRWPNEAAMGRPAIAGTAQVGETLTADSSSIVDDNGLNGVTFSYQWIRNDGSSDTDIAGGTDSTYTLVAADEGNTIRVRVSFTDDDEYTESLISEATEAVSFAVQQQVGNNPATGALTISGPVQVGETLTADTSGIADADGLTNVSYSYQWISIDGTSDTDIAGATDSTYTLVADDEGKTIKVRVSFTDDANNDESLTSAATAAVADPEPPAKPTGLSTVSVSHDAVTLTWDDPQDDAITGYVILRRNRATSVPGEFTELVADTGSAATTYTDHSVAADTSYTYRIKAINGHGVSELSHWFRADTPASSPANSPATGAPTISGTVQVGETLTADTSGISDADGLTSVAYQYQWLADDADIAGATDTTYTLVDADEGAIIKLRVSFTDDAGNEETLTSAATDTVEARPNSPATGAPTIAGTAQVGETLTADTSGIVDQDGLTNVAYSYQWLADDADIAGATDSSYIPTDGDEGAIIKLRVSFTDDAGNEESLTSAATKSVVMPLTASLHDVPESHDGHSPFTFELRFSEELKLSYKKLRDHAFTVTGGTILKAQRIVKSSNIRWRITVMPDSDSPVHVLLPSTTRCGAQGGICANGGRKLSNALSFTVSGPGG